MAAHHKVAAGKRRWLLVTCTLAPHPLKPTHPPIRQPDCLPPHSPQWAAWHRAAQACRGRWAEWPAPAQGSCTTAPDAASWWDGSGPALSASDAAARVRGVGCV
jgi:hypothetical protein